MPPASAHHQLSSISLCHSSTRSCCANGSSSKPCSTSSNPAWVWNTRATDPRPMPSFISCHASSHTFWRSRRSKWEKLSSQTSFRAFQTQHELIQNSGYLDQGSVRPAPAPVRSAASGHSVTRSRPVHSRAPCTKPRPGASGQVSTHHVRPGGWSRPADRAPRAAGVQPVGRQGHLYLLRYSTDRPRACGHLGFPFDLNSDSTIPKWRLEWMKIVL